MSDHSFTVRLDMGYEDEKQAWEKLKRLQRKMHLSYNRIMTDAVNAYETDFVHLAPEDEARIIQQIQAATENKAIQHEPTDTDEAESDFSGSVMDFNFMGM